jgi:transposase-like protein
MTDTDSDTVDACPECDSASFTRRSRGFSAVPRQSDARYQCSDCGAYFDDPVERERRGTAPLKGLARDLDKADSWDELEARLNDA